MLPIRVLGEDSYRCHATYGQDMVEISLFNSFSRETIGVDVLVGVKGLFYIQYFSSLIQRHMKLDFLVLE